LDQLIIVYFQFNFYQAQDSRNNIELFTPISQLWRLAS
jgi:hypothetical protein